MKVSVIKTEQTLRRGFFAVFLLPLTLLLVHSTFAGGYVENISGSTVRIRWACCGQPQQYATLSAGQNSSTYTSDADFWTVITGSWEVWLGFAGPYSEGAYTEVKVNDLGWVSCYYGSGSGSSNTWCQRNY